MLDYGQTVSAKLAPLDTIGRRVPEQNTAKVDIDSAAPQLSEADATAPTSSGQSEGHQLIRGASARVFGYVVMMALSVVSTAAVTRGLGVTRFGQYATVITVSALVMTITDSGMTNLATHDYALLEGEHRDNAVGTLLGLRLSLTMLGTVLAMGFAFLAHYDDALLLGMFVANVAIFPIVIADTLSLPLINRLRLGSLSLLTLARQVIWTGGLIALSALRLGVLPLLGMLLIANALVLPATFRVSRNIGHISLRPRLAGWQSMVRATLMFSIATAVGTLYLNGTQLITSLAATHHQTGLFSLVFRVFLVTATIPILVGGAAVPLLARAARDDQDHFSYVLKRYLEISIVGGVGIALVLSASSGFIIPIVGGPRFHAAIPVASIQVFALVGTFAASPCSYGLLTLHRYRSLLIANACAMVVMIVATYTLARTDGAQGAAIASICGETTVAVLMLTALLGSQPKCRPAGMFVAKLLLISSCAAIVAFGPWLSALPRAVVVAGVYAALLLATRILPAELIAALPIRRGR